VVEPVERPGDGGWSTSRCGRARVSYPPWRYQLHRATQLDGVHRLRCADACGCPKLGSCPLTCCFAAGKSPA
jgi:hypothetical protein